MPQAPGISVSWFHMNDKLQLNLPCDCNASYGNTNAYECAIFAAVYVIVKNTLTFTI